MRGCVELQPQCINFLISNIWSGFPASCNTQSCLIEIRITIGMIMHGTWARIVYRFYHFYKIWLVSEYMHVCKNCHKKTIKPGSTFQLGNQVKINPLTLMQIFEACWDPKKVGTLWGFCKSIWGLRATINQYMDKAFISYSGCIQILEKMDFFAHHVTDSLRFTISYWCLYTLIRKSPRRCVLT